jgi:hypothetical protein
MTESIWWPEEFWWEKKVLPLGFVNLSVRQLATLMGGVVIGLLVSAPIAFPIAGVGFGGRVVVLLVFVGLAYVVAMRRVRMLPVELQLWFAFRERALKRLRTRLAEVRVLGRMAKVRVEPLDGPVPIHEMVVEDFKNPVPFAVSSRLKVLPGRSTVALYLDEEKVMEEAVSPEKLGYRLLYYPRQGDVGVHRLVAKLLETGEVLVSFQVEVKQRSADAIRPSFG